MTLRRDVRQRDRHSPKRDSSRRWCHIGHHLDGEDLDLGTKRRRLRNDAIPLAYNHESVAHSRATRRRLQSSVPDGCKRQRAQDVFGAGDPRLLRKPSRGLLRLREIRSRPIVRHERRDFERHLCRERPSAPNTNAATNAAHRPIRFFCAIATLLIRVSSRIVWMIVVPNRSFVPMRTLLGLIMFAGIAVPGVFLRPRHRGAQRAPRQDAL